MNKLDLSPLGGEPLAADDIEYLQSALADCINALGGLTEQSCVVISGVVITGPVAGIYNYTAGWVYLSGEIFKVQAGSFNNSMNAFFTIQTSNDPNGTVSYEDTSTQNIYKTREVAIINAASGPTANQVSARKYIRDFWVKVNGEVWTPAAFTAAAVNMAGLTYPDPVEYKMNEMGEVMFKGSMQAAGAGIAATNYIAFVLPLAYRPNRIIRAYCAGAGTMVELWVWPNGDVQVYGVGGALKECNLNAFRYVP